MVSAILVSQAEKLPWELLHYDSRSRTATSPVGKRYKYTDATQILARYQTPNDPHYGARCVAKTVWM